MGRFSLRLCILVVRYHVWISYLIFCTVTGPVPSAICWTVLYICLCFQMSGLGGGNVTVFPGLTVSDGNYLSVRLFRVCHAPNGSIYPSSARIVITLTLISLYLISSAVSFLTSSLNSFSRVLSQQAPMLARYGASRNLQRPKQE
jgi:hypothetical protein